jgi:hypothetical protein
MVNKVILDYLKKNSGKFELPVLKKKLISSGYTQKEVNEAADSLLSGGKVPSVEPAISKAEETRKIGGNLEKNSKWFKIAGISGILAVVFLIALVWFFELGSLTGLVLSFVVSIFLILFLGGFIVLGWKHNETLLRVASWILIGAVVLFLVFQIIGFFSPTFMKDMFIGGVSPSGIGDVVGSILEVMMGVVIFALIVLLSLVALGILFGVGLTKLGEKVPFAKVTGILNIIGWATLIIGVGVLVLLAAYIFGIILLFKVGKKSA